MSYKIIGDYIYNKILAIPNLNADLTNFSPRQPTRYPYIGVDVNHSSETILDWHENEVDYVFRIQVCDQLKDQENMESRIRTLVDLVLDTLRKDFTPSQTVMLSAIPTTQWGYITEPEALRVCNIDITCKVTKASKT